MGGLWTCPGGSGELWSTLWQGPVRPPVQRSLCTVSPSALCRVLSGSNFHSSHSPRPLLPTLALPPVQAGNLPGQGFAAAAECRGWLSRATAVGGETGEGALSPRYPTSLGPTTAALSDSQGWRTGEEGGGCESTILQPQVGETYRPRL